jgi:hypothetical protein
MLCTARSFTVLKACTFQIVLSNEISGHFYVFSATRAKKKKKRKRTLSHVSFSKLIKGFRLKVLSGVYTQWYWVNLIVTRIGEILGTGTELCE